MLLLAPPFSGANVNAPPFEMARVFVRLGHVANFIVNANHSIMSTAEKLCVADRVADCVWLAIPQGTDGSTSEIKSKPLIFAGADFVDVQTSSKL